MIAAAAIVAGMVCRYTIPDSRIESKAREVRAVVVDMFPDGTGKPRALIAYCHPARFRTFWEVDPADLRDCTP